MNLIPLASEEGIMSAMYAVASTGVLPSLQVHSIYIQFNLFIKSIGVKLQSIITFFFFFYLLFRDLYTALILDSNHSSKAK